MKTIIKITQMGLAKLNNAEYTNLSNRTYALISAATPAALGLEEGDLARYYELLGTMRELVAQSRISNETAEMEKLDKERDDIGVYILTTVRNSRKSPLSAIAAASTRLYNVLKPYTGFQKLANQQETVKVNGMVADLKKASVAADVQALGLNELVNALEQANSQYEELTIQRTENRAASKIDNSKTVRAEMDVLYDYFMTLAFVESVANPTEATAKFVQSMNALVAEINMLYNQRSGNSGGANSSTSGGGGTGTGGTVPDGGGTPGDGTDTPDTGGNETPEPPGTDTPGTGGGGTTPDTGGGDDSGGTNDDGGADFN